MTVPRAWRIAKAPEGGEETAEHAGEAAERAGEALREAVGHGIGHGEHGGHGSGHGGGHGGGHAGGHGAPAAGHGEHAAAGHEAAPAAHAAGHEGGHAGGAHAAGSGTVHDPLGGATARAANAATQAAHGAEAGHAAATAHTSAAGMHELAAGRQRGKGAHERAASHRAAAAEHRQAAKEHHSGGGGAGRDDHGRFASKRAYKRAVLAVRAKSFEGYWGAPMPMYDQQTEEQNDFGIGLAAKAMDEGMGDCHPFAPAALCVVFDDQGRIATVSRPEPPYEQAIPGGLVDPGETPEQAAIRELEEELGIQVTDVVQLCEVRSPTDGRLVTVFGAGGFTGEPWAAESDTRFDWLDPAALLAQSELYRPTVRELMAAGHLTKGASGADFPEMVADGGEVLSEIGETAADGPDYAGDGGDDEPPVGDDDQDGLDPSIFDQPTTMVVTARATNKDDAGGYNAGGDGFDDHPYGEPTMFRDLTVEEDPETEWLTARAKGFERLDKAFFLVPGVTQRPTPDDEAVTKDAPGAAYSFRGIPVIIDRPQGYVQRGTAPDGTLWERTYLYDYGYIPGTDGGDAEGLDVYVGPCLESPFATWIVQLGFDGAFDEYKLMIGFDSLEAGVEAYCAHTPPQLLGAAFLTDLGMIAALLGQDPRSVIETLKGQHLEAAMSKVKKDAMPAGPGGQPNGDEESPIGGGGADIVSIAADRLNDVANSIDAAGGVVTPELGEAVESVVALLEAVAPIDMSDDDMDEDEEDDLPAGPGEPVAMSATEKQKKRAEKRALWKAGKLTVVGSFTKAAGMTPEAFVAKCAALVRKVAGTHNPALRKMRVAAVNKMLSYGPELFGGETAFGATGSDVPALPVYTEAMVDTHTADVGTPAPEPVKSQFAYDPAYVPNDNSQQQYNAGSPQFMEKTAQVLQTGSGKLAALLKAAGACPGCGEANPTDAVKCTKCGADMATKAGPAGDASGVAGDGPNLDPPEDATSAGVDKGEGPNTEGGAWTQEYADSLPDEHFLHVEPGAKKDPAGRSTPSSVRHFPYKNDKGEVDPGQLRDAVEKIPNSGMPDAAKTELGAKAKDLLDSHEDAQKSALEKGDRGDDGWPKDLADPAFLAGTSKPRGLMFGHDRIVTKAKAVTTRQAATARK